MSQERTRKESDTALTGLVGEQAVYYSWATQWNAFTREMEEMLPLTYEDEIEKFQLFFSALKALGSSTISGSLFNHNATAKISRLEETRFDVNVELEDSLFVCLKSYVIKKVVTFSPRVDHGRIKLMDVQGIDFTLSAVNIDAVLGLQEATLNKNLNGKITLNGTIINPLRTDDLLPISIAFGEADAIGIEGSAESLTCNHNSEHERNLQAQHLRFREAPEKSESVGSLFEVLDDCLECGLKRCNDLSHWVGDHLKRKLDASETLHALTHDKNLEV
ncbi:MAG: hypothetical protein P4L53_21260 [Candidatus Obscuribacterales bacterium]|nr:hypothetical protein [Candidatus Obscuribacterales bacterium]